MIETFIKPVEDRSHEWKVNIAFILPVKVNIALYRDKIKAWITHSNEISIYTSW